MNKKLAICVPHYKRTDLTKDGLSSLKYEVIHQEEFLDKHEFVSVK